MRTSPWCGSAFPSWTASATATSPPWATGAGLRLLEKILDALLDRQDRDAPEESFELVM